MKPRIFYKTMFPGGEALVTHYTYDTSPKGVGVWLPKQKPVPCQSGYHVVEPLQIGKWAWNNTILWEVEVRGEGIRCRDKWVFPEMRLIRRVARLGPTLVKRLRKKYNLDPSFDQLPIPRMLHITGPKEPAQELGLSPRPYRLRKGDVVK